jgi:hypothetical protein
MAFQEPGIEHPDDWMQPVPKQSRATSTEDREDISVTVK